MKFTCQLLLPAILAFSLFRLLKEDFNGREAKKPGGYKGAVATIIAILFLLLTYWKAGALSLIFGSE